MPLCLAAQSSPQPPAGPKLAPVHESITVTETISTEAPAAITVIDKTKLEQTSGVNIDDRLRDVPGFSLFRRSSSLVANPTTQGISLRGISSSGASRTLVLWDGIPENDPFGGWVYWDRFAPQELDRIEISRGASTSLFGDLALGGAIALFSHPAARHHIQASYEGGNRDTHELTAGASNLWRRAAVSGFVRAFSTDGYFIVPSNIRGAIDKPASVQFVAGNTRVDLLGGADRLFLRLDILAEHRENGTILQTNSTGLGSVAGSYSHDWRRDQISILGYYTRETFRASFSSIGANRNSERLTFRQIVPSEGEGGAALWSHRESRWHVLAGGDIHRVEGFSTDRLFPTGQRIGGGTQVQRGVFGQFDFGVGPLQVFLGLRYQLDRSNPSAGFVYGRGRVRAHGSTYSSFRAPTLNELFREFRVGNAITQANPALRPETLFGAEVGVEFIGESTHAGVTLFRNELTGLITNVTLSSVGGTITRQRQNAADALSRGLEANVRHAWRDWRAEAAYLYVDSQYVTGPLVPQVPRHQGSVDLAYQHGGTLASVAVRSYSYQFEDDLNRFVLPGFASVQLAIDQRIARGLSARLAIDNLLDRQYLVGFSPTPTIGSPRLWRAGLRWGL